METKKVLRPIYVSITLLVLVIGIFSLISPLRVQAGEAWQSVEDFEQEFGYIEFDTWGNFSADPSENPPPLAGKALSFARISYMNNLANRLMTDGKCTEVQIDYYSGFMQARFKLGSRFYREYKMDGFGNIKAQSGFMLTDDEGGWMLPDPDLKYLKTGTELDLVEEGPGNADSCDSIITFRDDATVNGSSIATLPTSSNYTLDSKLDIYGPAYEAGGDISLNELGQNIADASTVTWYNVINSTLEAKINHDDGTDAINAMFTTFDQMSTSALGKASAGASLSVAKRFVQRVKLKASAAFGSAKRVTGASWKGLTFLKNKATSLISTTGRTALNSLKAGVSIVARPLKMFGMVGGAVLLIVGLLALVYFKRNYLDKR